MLKRLLLIALLAGGMSFVASEASARGGCYRGYRGHGGGFYGSYYRPAPRFYGYGPGYGYGRGYGPAYGGGFYRGYYAQPGVSLYLGW